LVCENGYVPNSDTDYCPPNFYGKSKVIGEEKVRSSNLKCEWVIVRPTSIWGPWFDYSYKAFFKTIDKNRYMHIGKNEFQKPASFVGNTVHILMKILLKNDPEINNSTYYLADYPGYSTKEWANTIQKVLNSKKVKTAPLWLLKIIAIFGDYIKKILKFDSPLTSFRLNNMLTGGAYPVGKTTKVVGELPYDLNESVYLTAKWMYENNMIKHKPKKI
jgi:nucleoside-diphosphate-sugar epimerase